MNGKGKIGLSVLVAGVAAAGIIVGVNFAKAPSGAENTGTNATVAQQAASTPATSTGTSIQATEQGAEFRYKKYTIKLKKYDYCSSTQSGELFFEVSKDSGEMETPNMLSGVVKSFGKDDCMCLVLNGGGNIESKGKMSDGKLLITTRFYLTGEVPDEGQIGIKTAEPREDGKRFDPQMMICLKDTEEGATFTAAGVKAGMSSERIRILGQNKPEKYVVEVQEQGQKKETVFRLTDNAKSAYEVKDDDSQYAYEYGTKLDKKIDLSKIQHIYVNGRMVK